LANVSSNIGRVLEADKEVLKLFLIRQPRLAELEANLHGVLRENGDGRVSVVGNTNLAHLKDVTFTLLGDSWFERENKTSCK
jgi:hypothetical protein